MKDSNTTRNLRRGALVSVSVVGGFIVYCAAPLILATTLGVGLGGAIGGLGGALLVAGAVAAFVLARRARARRAEA